MGSGHENLDQNDGFTDCADLSNVTSDEGTDADIKKQSEKTATLTKAMFNDDEAEEQLDLSGLIRTLEKNVDKKATQIDSTQNADGAKKDVATDTENGKKNKSNKKIPEEPTLDDDQGSKRARRRTVKGEEFEALT